MCGILGWIGGESANPVARKRSQDGLRALRSRGPDGSRLEHGEDWTLGHTRLAILDLTERGAQPMRDAKGRWLVFNGEIYNFQELRTELENEGLSFHSTGDAEVLLQALGHWGVAVLPRLRGMFAFGWLDSSRKELILARDRYGVKPLAWEETSGGIRFASDLFALDAMAGGTESRSIDPDAARRYLLLGHVPAPLTIWEGVQKLLPAHFLRVQWNHGGIDKIENKPYWEWSSVQGSVMPDNAASGGEFECRVVEAVRLRLISDVPVGLLLSGGIDSTLVATACSEMPEAQIPCFTMGFDDPASDERPAASTLAAHLHLKHETFEAESTPIDLLFKEMWNAYDEPFADSSALPMLILCREIRKRVKVAISGDGGDEIWCGYPWHRAMWRGERLSRRLPAILKPLVRWLGSHADAGTAYKTRVLGASNRLEMWTVLKTGLTDSMSRWLPLQGSKQFQVSDVFREAAGRVGEIEDVLDWSCRMDMATYLPDDLMVKADRASMHFGLELREPLLDHQLTLWGLGIPSAMRFCKTTGLGKTPTREYLAGKLPDEVLRRPKQGFTPPLNKWLDGPLRATKLAAITALESGELKPLLIPDKLRSWELCAHLLKDDHDQFLWRVVCFYGWLKARSKSHE